MASERTDSPSMDAFARAPGALGHADDRIGTALDAPPAILTVERHRDITRVPAVGVGRWRHVRIDVGSDVVRPNVDGDGCGCHRSPAVINRVSERVGAPEGR